MGVGGLAPDMRNEIKLQNKMGVRGLAPDMRIKSTETGTAKVKKIQKWREGVCNVLTVWQYYDNTSEV